MRSWKQRDIFVISTEPVNLHSVKEGLQKQGYAVTDAELAWVAKNNVRVEGANAESLLKLLDALEELDDIQKVDANFEMDDAELEQA